MTTHLNLPRPDGPSGSEPRLRDFEAAMAEGARRRRRRGVRSAGAGAALATVIGVVVGLGGASTSSGAQDEIQFVVGDLQDDSEEFTEPGSVRLGPPAAPESDESESGRQRRRRARGDSGAAAAAPSQPRRPGPVTRSKGPSVVPQTCSGQADWCLSASATPTGKEAYTVRSTMCLNASVPLSALDYPTQQETDFEILAGTTVIWRWSDGQTFAAVPHTLSALPADCFTWQTLWDRHDSRGERVGKARLTLRVRSLATQRTDEKKATTVFVTS